MAAPGGWTVQSRHKNLIAFKFQAGHLRNALRAASSSDAEHVEIKLTSHSKSAGAAATQRQAKPYLCLTSRGMNSNMTHEIPIGRVFSSDEIDELIKQSGSPDACPYYVDIQGEQMRLQALVDTLKNVDGSVSLVTTQRGSLYLQVTGTGAQLASEVQGLNVVPSESRVSEAATPLASPERRLQDATRRNWAHTVVVQAKQLAKSLHSSQIPLPVKLLLGIADQGGHVQFVCVFASDTELDEADPDINLSYQLPVRDED